MKKKYKICLIIVVVLLFAILGGFVYFRVVNKKQEVLPPVNEVKVTNSIDNYGYTLEDRDLDYFKEKFEELKVLLNEEDYDKKTYISLVSELFIIDLYTIDNKISRYDVGGLEYVYEGAKESFKSVIENSIYKSVENNLDDSRTQELPVVSTTEIIDIEDTIYEMPDKTKVNGYKVNLKWKFEKDLGYDDKAVLILIPDGKKISVVFYKAK